MSITKQGVVGIQDSIEWFLNLYHRLAKKSKRKDIDYERRNEIHFKDKNDSLLFYHFVDVQYVSIIQFCN